MTYLTLDRSRQALPRFHFHAHGLRHCGVEIGKRVFSDEAEDRPLFRLHLTRLGPSVLGTLSRQERGEGESESD